MQFINLNQLISETDQSNQRWKEFLRVPEMSLGLYRLKAGQADEQLPHSEDEVYYIVDGKASFRCGEEVIAVSAGSVIYVERLAEHRFFDIAKDLTILVFFAPAEGSLKK